MDVDVPPLIETLSLMGSYEIDAIDIINESPFVLKRENVMSLMRTANQKLRVMDINDSSLGKDFLRYKTMSWMQVFGPSDAVDFVQQYLKDFSGFDVSEIANLGYGAKLQRRRQELTQTTQDQSVDDEAVYYKVAGDCPKGCVYSLRSLWRKKRRYVDLDASTSQMLAQRGMGIFMILGNGSEKELLYSVFDPLLIKDGSETKSNNFASDPLLIREGLETGCNYNCTL
ncbi:hypothetical protein Syun_027793 [Stephania yunnanensis]|uniref:Uncharacterized protein n=1 Tax=Stephania yunnanensis TaxID=152371 RepID=A0AAP0ELC5_9MAGN